MRGLQCVTPTNQRPRSVQCLHFTRAPPWLRLHLRNPVLMLERGGRLDCGEARVSPGSFFQSLWLKHKTFKWKGLFIHSQKEFVWCIMAFSESDHFWKKLNKLVCFVKVEIIRKNLKVCFSFSLNPKLPSLARLLEGVLSISVLHLQGSLNLFLKALNSLDNNAFLWDHAQTRQCFCIFSTHTTLVSWN